MPDFPIIAAENDFTSGLQEFWHFELFSVGNTPIRVNQIVFALIIFIVGVVISRLVTRLLRQRLLNRQRIHSNAAFAVERVLFYILVVVVTLAALQTVNIPITIFTVLGGAVAIGIGFGAQTIFNNFISGLILMFEGHVRIGDLVEVEGSMGHVEEIGGRCTRIKRVDGVDLLVPNAFLLENRVTNWTLSDSHIRTSITVGVAYGSPTARVSDLLLQAARENSRVLKEPAPLVLFNDFADSTLTFELLFWTEIHHMIELRLVRSEIRFKVEDLFRAAQISIAFPQRDLHLDAAAPIPVRVVPETPAGQ